jgi:hypothetical protein
VPSDVRALLKGYGFDLTAALTATGTTASGSAQVTGVNTTKLAPQMIVSGAGIAAGSRISTVDVVDSVNGKFTMDVVAGASATVPLTFTYFLAVDDDWLAKRRDRFILPWVTRVTRQSFAGVQRVTEFYDGNGGPILALRRRPIVALISISYTNVDSNLYYLTPSAIQVIPEEGLLKAKANFNESTYIPIFYRGDRNVKVIYDVGFATMPDDVAEAVTCLMAEQALAHAASKTGGGSAMSGQGYNKSFGDAGKWGNRRRELTSEAMALLRPYMTGGGG